MDDETGTSAQGAETADGGEPGLGHNQPEVVWERWQKKRTFVRALEGTYSDLQQGLMSQQRVYSTLDMNWKGGPQAYGKHVINPQSAGIAQSIETHVHAYAPGGYAQNHGHMNSAAFYVLRGAGYDVHDGERMDYEAGDVLLVENGCVHQHFNASDTEELVVVVMKAKPLFLFMHMLFQKTVKLPPKEPVAGMDLYKPPADW
ncbi:MAG: cupin domain-containing protein [Alphaproteobacteria bacterium]|nr:cupin domain-containing protein [Alphaproteobacteria bacterium]